MELFRLFGSILIDDKDAIDKLNKTDKKAATTAEKLGKLAGGAAKVGAAVVGMGVAAATGLTAMATKTAEAGDRVDKMSLKLGLSREGFQEWDYIMAQNGMSIETMQGGMKTLVNSFDDMKKGGKTATDAFGRLGLSMDDLAGMSQEDMFETTLAALQGVEDQTERAALANDLFGRSGSELAPLLAQSSESIEELRNQAHDMGMVLGDDAVNGAVKLGDTIDMLKRAGGGLMNSLGTALMPVLQSVLDIIVQNMPMIQNLFTQLAPVLASVFENLLPPLIDLAVTLLPPILTLIEQILPFLGTLMDAIMPVLIQLLGTLLPPIMQIVEAVLPLLLQLIEPLLPLLQPILALLQPFIDLLMMIIEPLTEILNLILPPIIALFTEIATRVLPVLSTALGWLAELVGGVVKNAFNTIRPIIEGLKTILGGIISFIKNVFTGHWKGAWEGIKQIFSGIWDSFVGIVKAPLNWIIGGLNAFIKSLNKIKIPDWVPQVGGKGINLPEIPKLEKGLDYVPYDEYPALLHKGERVLTKEENERGQDRGVIINMTGPVSIRSDDDIRRVAEELDRLRRRGLAAQGV